jgi:hypothetical protein
MNENNQILFQQGDCLTFQLSDGNFGGVIIYEAQEYREVMIKYFVLVTNVYQASPPTLEDFIQAKTYGRTGSTPYLDDILLIWNKRLVNFGNKLQTVGNLQIDNSLEMGGFRHQYSFLEFDESVKRTQKIDYMERGEYPIQNFIR